MATPSQPDRRHYHHHHQRPREAEPSHEDEDWFQLLSRFHEDNINHEWEHVGFVPPSATSGIEPVMRVNWRVFGRKRGHRPTVQALTRAIRPLAANLIPDSDSTKTSESLGGLSANTTESSATWPSSGSAATLNSSSLGLPAIPKRVGKGRGARRQEIQEQTQANRSPGLLGKLERENTDPNPSITGESYIKIGRCALVMMMTRF